MLHGQGNQLTRDLNVVIGTGNNWKIPVFWAPVIKYISAPILAIIVGFAYPLFYTLRNDPLQIYAFSISHIVVVIVIVGLIVPRAVNLSLPADRREKVEHYAPGVTLAPVSAGAIVEVEETFEDNTGNKE